MCVKYGVIVLSDEVYERLHYLTEPFPRIATLSPEIARNTVTIGSIGKAFAATGWRVGYAIGDRDLIRHLKDAHIILSFTTAGPAQWAAAAGLEQAERNSFWELQKLRMKAKIDSLCEVFQELDLPVFPSKDCVWNPAISQVQVMILMVSAVCRAFRCTLRSCQCRQNPNT